MRVGTKAAFAALIAALVLAVSLLPAFAADIEPQVVALLLGDEAGSGYTGSYGQEIDLQPTVLTKMELPGDTFSFQAYVTDSDGVKKWLPITDWEPISLEHTNTVPVFGFQLGYDGLVQLSDYSEQKLTYPVDIRAQYKPGGKDTTPTASYTESETITAIKAAKSKVVFTKLGTARKAGTKFRFHVLPNSGEGTVTVTISKAGITPVSYEVVTDDTGYATATLPLGATKGSYSVSARFLGNSFAPASATFAKRINATR